MFSIEAFVKWSGGHYTKIFAFEPDPTTFAVLENFVRERGYKNVTLLKCGAYDKKTVLSFKTGHKHGSTFSADGTELIALEKIDDVIGDEPVNLIKVSFLGDEIAALKGAAQTIKNNKPVLAVVVCQSKADLITLPQYIKSFYDGYKFYLRKHSSLNELEIFLYAIP